MGTVSAMLRPKLRATLSMPPRSPFLGKRAMMRISSSTRMFMSRISFVNLIFLLIALARSILQVWVCPPPGR